MTLNERHILTVFDRDLDSVQAMILTMGGLVETALSDAVRALDTRDAALADRVRQSDAAIDALEEQVNFECARLIALRSPTATDLRRVLTVMKIAASLERCGDHAKNIGKRSTVLAQMTEVPGATGSVRQMARQVQQLLRDALDAYLARDADLAADVRQRDREIDQMCNALFRELLTHMMEDPQSITPCIHLQFIAKNIERVGDHATGIAEQVIYLVTGQHPGEARPKADDLTPTLASGSPR